MQRWKILLILPQLATAQSFYFFGDSLTDTGNIGRLVGGIGPGYPGFSVSNGPTWPAYLDAGVLGFSEVQDPAIPIESRSLDFSTALSTTSAIANFQTGPPFVDFLPRLQVTSRDLAFLWGGANDFLPIARETAPDPAEIESTIHSGVTNLTTAVSNLQTAGIENFAIISLLNLGLAPGIGGFETQGARLADTFNARLKKSLNGIPNSLWIDANAFLNDAVANPAAYALGNVTNSAAPDAEEGIPSPLTSVEQDSYLFYDDIHPTTAVHRQFAGFVAEHLRLGWALDDAFLITDALLGLDDRSGFETSRLEAGKFDFKFSTSYFENRSAPRKRSTESLRADLDFAISERYLLGLEFLYAEGDSGRSDLEASGVGIDALLHGTRGVLRWEAGLGLGFLSGDLARDYPVGTFAATGEHEAGLVSAHVALRDDHWSFAGLEGFWQIGLKQRFVRRSTARETGAASLDLAYESKTLATTIASFGLGFDLSNRFALEMSLDPILFHSGGEISARQASGLASFTTPDQSGYESHTARANLIYAPTPDSSASAGFVVGSDDTWGANLAYRLHF